MDVYFWIVMVLSGLSFWAVFRYCDKRVRPPFLVYTVSYLVTTVIGATYIGLSDAGPLWRLFDLTIDTSLITQTTGPLYWFVLYAPLFVPSVVILVSCPRRSWVSKQPRVWDILDCRLDAFSFSVVLVIVSAYCAAELASHGYLTNFSTSLQSSGDYQSLITSRSTIINQLSGQFYGLVYVGLPTLSVIALWQWWQIRSESWLSLYLLSAGVIAYLVLATIQKGPLFVYALGVFLALLILRVLRPWVIPLIASVAMLVLTALQVVFLGDWSLLQSVSLLIFRMASSYPFYINLYPKHMPYLPFNFGFGLLGWGVTLDTNLRVFDYMYPDISWVQGAAAAPAHVCAFAQGGIVPSIFVMLLIGGFIAIVARFRHTTNSPLSFGIYIQGLICLYFLTQVSIRGVLLESYGLIYSAIPLFMLVIVRQVVILAVRQIRCPDIAVIGNPRMHLAQILVRIEPH